MQMLARQACSIPHVRAGFVLIYGFCEGVFHSSALVSVATSYSMHVAADMMRRAGRTAICADIRS